MYQPLVEGSDSPILSEGADSELSRFAMVIKEMTAELDELALMLQRDGKDNESLIFQAHALMLNDPVFATEITDSVRTKKIGVMKAVKVSLETLANTLENSQNALIASRSTDAREILSLFKTKWLKASGPERDIAPTFHENMIVVVPELLASIVLQMIKSKVKGCIVTIGTRLSHAAILARSYDFPVIRLKSLPNPLPPFAQLDAEHKVVKFADATFRAPLQNRINAVRGIPVLNDKIARFWLSVSDPEQIRHGTLADVEGVGLYRTEVFFMKHHEEPPEEEAQYEDYKMLAVNARSKPITIRTLDVGADKMLPYLLLGPQANPHLGLRAHRLYRYHPELFITQIKAILRAAVYAAKPRVIFPMIETYDELLFVRDLYDTAILELKQSGKPFSTNISKGILIEVPSIIWSLDAVLPLVDFVGVGTNDLIQFLFAADRNNSAVAKRSHAFDPSMLTMMKHIAEKAKIWGKDVLVCGEALAEPGLVLLYKAMGFNDFVFDRGTLDALRRNTAFSTSVSYSAMCKEVLSAKSFHHVLDILAKHDVGVDLTEESEEHGRTIDPVCNMMVDPLETVWRDEGPLGNWYFCSKTCRDIFQSREASHRQKN